MESWWSRQWFYHTWFLRPRLGKRELQELEYINENQWGPSIKFKRYLMLIPALWVIVSMLAILSYPVTDWWLITITIIQWIQLIWYVTSVFGFIVHTRASLLMYYGCLVFTQATFPVMFIVKNLMCSQGNYSYITEMTCKDNGAHEIFYLYMYLASVYSILILEGSIFLQSLVILFLNIPSHMTGLLTTSLPLTQFINNHVFVIGTYISIHGIGMVFYETKRRAYMLSKQLNAEMELRQRSMSYMFHELRNPLNVIMLAVDQSRNKQLSQKTKPCIFIMENILNDALDFQKISQGSFTLNTVSFSFNEMLQQAVTSVEPLWTAKNQHFTLKISSDVHDLSYRVIGDPMRIRQIILNYLSNAVKYTDSHGTITMHVNTETNNDTIKDPESINIRIAVTDSGVGIEEKDQLQLFKPFVQITNRMSGTTRGTGLGLSIVASLIDQMGGTYGVTSTLGVGSTFYCTIPLKLDMSTSGEKSHYSKSTRTPNSSAIDIESIDLSELSPILVVDDNILICKVVKEILNNWNIDVTVAHNGKEALDIMHSYLPETAPYKAILMDDMMPVMFGQTAIKQLRSEGYTTQIIGITGNVEDADKILLYGANHVIIKPINKNQLMKKLIAIHEATLL